MRHASHLATGRGRIGHSLPHWPFNEPPLEVGGADAEKAFALPAWKPNSASPTILNALGFVREKKTILCTCSEALFLTIGLNGCQEIPLQFQHNATGWESE